MFDQILEGYAELHCLSNFSFLRGASHPAELVARAADLGYRALALTDECSMAGVVRAHEALTDLEGATLKLIIGAEFHTLEDLHLVLLATSHAGYSQLCTLITSARRRSTKGRYRIEQSDFESALEGCLALWLPPADTTFALAQGNWLRESFPDRSWMAVELHRGARDAVRLAALQTLAQQCALPMVATGDVHMHRRSRRLLQDVLTATRHNCSIADAGRKLFPNGERHLRSLPALSKAYPRALLDESLRIAARCHFSLTELRYEYPPENVPAGIHASDHLRSLVEHGQQRRWPAGTPEKVQPLIEKELKLIAELSYEHFFLTVSHIVTHARSLGILCQGRGSAANSAVCYALGITDVNPDQIDVLFERFISRERKEPPDIDVDFEHERREEVIQHIYEYYGRDRTALAATVICYRTRSARRDIARALGWQPDELVPEAEAGRFAFLVRELRGFPRHLSQHVGGFVISGTPLHELVPIENAAMPGRTVIQWDKDDLDAVKFIKVDVLALGMLTAIRRCLTFTAQWRCGPRAMTDIPQDDRATYDMICAADTIGVFQIESRAQMSMLPRLKPRKYYDLVIETAIVRPGPIQGGMVHPYLRNRLDPENVHYETPELKKVLERTLGVPIFQEQVMQIAIEAADFTAGEADQLRRSMAAWKRSGGLEKFRERLLTGMRRKNYTDEFAERIYKQMLGFGEYGFPESHAASFALLTYISSWLKCHEPAAFFAALCNSQPMGFYHPAQLLQAARRAGVTVLGPDVLRSDWDYSLEELDAEDRRLAIRIGLRQVRSLREDEARRIVAERPALPAPQSAEARFRSISDLAHRAALDRRALRALAAAGALRSLSAHRHDAIWRALAVEPLPPLLAGSDAVESGIVVPVPSEAQDIVADYRHLGLSTGRHPLSLLRSWLQQRQVHNSQQLRQLRDGSPVRVCGIITHLQQPGTASGVTFMSLEDESGIVNVIIWPQIFQRQSPTALSASLLLVSGVLQHQSDVMHVVARQLHDRSGWLSGIARRSRDFR